jgi:hypothetical protein
MVDIWMLVVLVVVVKKLQVINYGSGGYGLVAVLVLEVVGATIK